MGEPNGGYKLTPATIGGFAAMCVGMFMAILDIQIVATSLPTMQAALGLRPDEMSWAQTSYLIAEVIAIALTGLLTRALSMRGLFCASLALFTIASIGCAASTGLGTLITWRIVQGFAGGTLIPAVFAAVFLLFPVRRQGVATTIAGVLAVLAPTIGPIVGGWITDTLSWRWLFLINVGPGIVAGTLGALLLPRERADLGLLRKLDLAALGWIAISLASLVIGLKQAPLSGWFSGTVLGLLGLSIASATAFVRRTLRMDRGLVDLRLFADPRFLVGCMLSFILGMGLFGSVYLMPVFLAFVRHHEAFEIGKIMLVTGVAQLVTAPLAVFLERRSAAWLLSAGGFACFSGGLFLGAFHTSETDFAAMFWPQLVRGGAIMFCLLPPTRIALGHLARTAIADASALFNLMRNLGGAIGLALIDTVLYGRSPVHAERLAQRLLAGDETAATLIGLPLKLFRDRIGQPINAAATEFVRPMIERTALITAVNEAWAMLALLTALAVLALALLAGRAVSSPESPRRP